MRAGWIQWSVVGVVALVLGLGLLYVTDRPTLRVLQGICLVVTGVCIGLVLAETRR